MWQYLAKVALTAAVVVAVAEIAKRSAIWGAAVASLPRNVSMTLEHLVS
jgi:hypothetical protein